MEIRLLLPLAGIISSLLMGLFVYFKDRKNPLNRKFCWFSVAVVASNIQDLFIILPYSLDILLIIYRILGMGTVWAIKYFIEFNWSLFLPDQQLPKKVKLVVNVLTVFFSLAFLTTLMIESITITPHLIEKDGVLFVFFILYLIAGIGYAMYFTAKNYRMFGPAKKKIYNAVLLSYAMGFSIVIFYIIWILNQEALQYYYIFEVLFFSGMAYSIIHHHFLDIQSVIHRTVAWIFLSSLIFIQVFAILYFIRNWIDQFSTLQTSVLFTVLALLLFLYARTIQPHINHLFQRKKYDLQKVLEKFIQEIALLKGLDNLVDKIIQTLSKTFYLSNISFVLYNNKLKQYVFVKGLNTSTSIKFFPQEKLFFEWLKIYNKPVSFDDIENDTTIKLISNLEKIAQEYFNKVQAKVLIPLVQDNKLIGLVNLGQKKNLKNFSSTELEFMDTLRIEASISLSNSLLFNDVTKMSEELHKWANELENKVEERTNELEKNKQAIEQAYHDLKELDHYKSEFISIVSHQLRTPITGINWYVEMLLSGDVGEITSHQRDYLDEVYESGQRMVRLINELLNVSRLESGRLKIEPKQVQIEDFIQKIIDEVKPLTMAKKCACPLTTPKTKLPLIMIDPDLLRQVIQNLITNAIKYSTPEKCDITVAIERKNNIDQEITSDYIIISVTDKGIGIPKDIQPRIFNKFFRANNAIKLAADGSGLGLYIAKMIIEASGGKIWFISKEGEGTTFYVAIPIDGMKKKEGSKVLN